MVKTDRCPICNVPLKPANLLRHLNDTHPRHPDTPGLLEKLKEEPGRIPPKKVARPIRVPKWQIAIVVVILLGGVGAYYLVSPGPQPFPCLTGPESGPGLIYHWHTQLTIFSGAAPVPIPGDVGRSASCTQPLHTHDATGRIHIETEANRLYSVGDFFSVWRKSFDTPIQMLVNGTEVTPSPNVNLHNLEAIELHYTSFV